MNPYKNNGTRTAVHLHHPAFGTMEFAWDSSDWIVVCFHSADATRVPSMKVLFSNFYNEKPMTVEKQMGRSIWNALSTAELRWKGTLAPCAPSRLSALHEATA
jgi:hypothetical protein